jgi:hypothetical protein
VVGIQENHGPVERSDVGPQVGDPALGRAHFLAEFGLLCLQAGDGLWVAHAILSGWDAPSESSLLRRLGAGGVCYLMPGRLVTSMPAFGLLFLIFGVLGLVSVKKGRSVLPDGPLHQLAEAGYVVMITFGAA